MVGRVTPIGTTNAAKTAPTLMGTESWAHHHSGLEPLGVIFFEHRCRNDTERPPILQNIRENQTPTSSWDTTDWCATREEQTTTIL